MKENDFRIDRLKDGSFRITRTDVDGDFHTHMNSRKLAMIVIHNVCLGKIPLNSCNYTLESMYRLSDDEGYRNKIKAILEVRKQKSKKEKYYNPGRKASGGKFLC